MKTITIRDLRQRWPETEKSLGFEGEILITRDGQPVAKLVKWEEARPRRTRWDPEKHALRIQKILGKRLFPSADASLAECRADRKL
jgi:antitoxin (DNA-binding transcriptional repressor) of toxin-antitoxin stability system